MWKVAVGLLLGMATGSARGQGTTNFLQNGQHASSLLGTSHPIVNQPIDLTNLAAPLPTQSGGTWLTGLFKGFSTPSFPPTIGQSPLPPPSAFKSTHYPNKLQPMMPIMPTQ
jgi:hypothetical protein